MSCLKTNGYIGLTRLKKWKKDYIHVYHLKSYAPFVVAQALLKTNTILVYMILNGVCCSLHENSQCFCSSLTGSTQSNVFNEILML